ncbi:hypothetical protein EDB92DRAFT_1891399 [Lactarius akahatsu]|uniref:Uncharacterized protein n=1 Tax=Lactarius akahatsu TaxID=416441 RepID=A0AAD4Q9T9_9AGAM|nr:hypothetical protein EDB92DRAFT_1891399 [Lactarius akahatsu]
MAPILVGAILDKVRKEAVLYCTGLHRTSIRNNLGTTYRYLKHCKYGRAPFQLLYLIVIWAVFLLVLTDRHPHIAHNHLFTPAVQVPSVLSSKDVCPCFHSRSIYLSTWPTDVVTWPHLLATPRFNESIYRSLIRLFYYPYGSTRRQISICKACEEHWQSIPKSGHGIDFYMPDLLSGCATVRTRRR